MMMMVMMMMMMMLMMFQQTVDTYAGDGRRWGKGRDKREKKGGNE